MKKPNMSLQNRGLKKTNKPVAYLKATLILTALFFITYQATKPVQADAPIRCDKFCGSLPIAQDKVLTVPEQIRLIAREHNFKWEDYLVRLSFCESSFKQYVNNTRGNYPAGSVDRGIFGINDYWHSEVNNECAYDIRCATEFAIKMINNGRQNEWVCNKIILNK